MTLAQYDRITDYVSSTTTYCHLASDDAQTSEKNYLQHISMRSRSRGYRFPGIFDTSPRLTRQKIDSQIMQHC
jgi:hypothetical protein